jgi:hypothetical protein
MEWWQRELHLSLHQSQPLKVVLDSGFGSGNLPVEDPFGSFTELCPKLINRSRAAAILTLLFLGFLPSVDSLKQINESIHAGVGHGAQYMCLYQCPVNLLQLLATAAAKSLTAFLFEYFSTPNVVQHSVSLIEEYKPELPSSPNIHLNGELDTNCQLGFPM